MLLEIRNYSVSAISLSLRSVLSGHVGVANVGLDHDDAVTADDLDLGETLVAPGGVPGVTECPVVAVAARVVAVASELDGVVVRSVGGAHLAGDDT